MNLSYGGTLKFEYRDDEGIIAFNDTHCLQLHDRFDFEDYKEGTKTSAFPPMFQKLVQNAIAHELLTKTCFMFADNTINKITGLHHDILSIVAAYVDMVVLNGFRSELMPHQIIALEYALAHPKCLLAMDMGLGKTPTSLATILVCKFKKTLLICPAALKDNWISEHVKFVANTLPLIHIVNAKKAPSLLKFSGPCIFLISYSLLTLVEEHLKTIKFDAIICDEAHALKNWKSGRAKTAFMLAKNVDRLILLTGTPASSAKDLWNLLRFIDPKIFAQFFHYKPATHMYKPNNDIFYFAERYLWPEIIFAKGGRPQWAFRRSVRMEELHFLTRQFILRQKKGDILDLPPFIREHVVIGKATSVHKKLLEEKLAQAQELAESKGQMYAQSVLMEQVRETSRQKLPLVLKYITHLLESTEEKIIIWAHHKFMMEAIHEHLDNSKVKHVVVNGETPKNIRPKLFQYLETNPEFRVGVLSLGACGTGLTFTFIRLTVYAELTFNHIMQVQSEGRCHRIGQKANNVVAQYLILDNSLDNMLWRSMQTKTNNESLVLDNKKADFDFSKIVNIQPDQDETITNYIEYSSELTTTTSNNSITSLPYEKQDAPMSMSTKNTKPCKQKIRDPQTQTKTKKQKPHINIKIGQCNTLEHTQQLCLDDNVKIKRKYKKLKVENHNNTQKKSKKHKQQTKVKTESDMPIMQFCKEEAE